MENVLKLKNCVTDFETLDRADCENIEIMVFSDTSDLIDQTTEMDDSTVFNLWVECGEKRLMMDVSINELEFFAHSVLKQIEIIRKTYAEQIKTQYDLGCEI